MAADYHIADKAGPAGLVEGAERGAVVAVNLVFGRTIRQRGKFQTHQIIERIPHSRSCPPPGSPPRQAARAYRAAIADLAAQASPGIQTRPVIKSQSHRASAATRNLN